MIGAVSIRVHGFRHLLHFLTVALDWIGWRRVPVDAFLEGVDLTYWFHLEPLSPVPLLNGIQLLRDLSRDHGSDVGSSIVSQGTVAELAFIGGVALGSRTPTEALQRVSFALPLHSSHEQILVEQQDDHLVVEQNLHLNVDAESLHAVQVMFFSLIQQLCRFTAMRPPFFSRIEAVPHPVTGLGDIEELFDAQVVPSKRPSGRLWIRDEVARNPFRIVARDRSRTVDIRSIPPLAGSVRPLMDAMLHDSAPTIARVARAGGMTVRTMQRRLSQEGTSFSDQLDLVRRRLALQLIGREDSGLSEITDRLGYSSSPALVRAVRRLTGTTPMQLKRWSQ
ncbi:helix-turn-helix transcriptional regulator [Ruegeria marisrubri]|nr:helix-turn-helix transcriptional regulator [Ruegeria marisrubri]